MVKMEIHANYNIKQAFTGTPFAIFEINS